MKKLVQDEEFTRLRAMAEGTKTFEQLGLWERRAAFDLKEIKASSARTPQYGLLRNGLAPGGAARIDRVIVRFEVEIFAPKRAKKLLAEE
jgi:hypothetical protein